MIKHLIPLPAFLEAMNSIENKLIIETNLITNYWTVTEQQDSIAYNISAVQNHVAFPTTSYFSNK